MSSKSLRWFLFVIAPLTLGGLLSASAGLQPKPSASQKKPAAPQKKQSARKIDFGTEVLPLFKASCFECHGPHQQRNGLRLDNPTDAFKGGISGPVIVPGKSSESLLVRRLLGQGGKPRMPFERTPLSEEQIALIRAWIDQGAVWHEDAGIEKHWAYVKPVRPPVPKVKNVAWVRNPIDNFILARLEKEGLQPSPEAPKEILIRRVSLDLTGLPPTIAEVEAFVKDKSANAYEKVVDRLLASPHYGERQARIWLDLARYADTNGYEKDERRSIWLYRDWVINAFNQDMPFDQFTIEQIAGDLLPNATINQKIATGFHRNTMTNEEGGVDKEEQRWLTLVDRVNTTATVWLGTTMACAQCHDHKYDPFTQNEYYKMLAFFDNCEEPTLELLTPEQEAKRKELQAELAAQEAILKNAGDDKARLEAAKARMEELKKQIEQIKGPTTLVMQEKPGVEIPSTYLRIRGSFLSKGELVQSGVPAVLNPFPPGKPRNRLGLAYWLVSPENPLTARVMMNRFWEQYFGHGLVETSEDFGTQGARPTHPELLDWLATEFIRRHWSMKAMHRLIVTSATYRQSSKVTPALLARDPKNQLYARGARFRLEAEMIRDTALAASGLLNKKIGGPSVFPLQPEGIWDIPYSGDRWVTSPGEERYRRGIYTFWRRTAPYPAFMTFDATSRESCTVRRARTNTPLQALTLLNDPAFLEAARALAERMIKEGGPTPASKATYGFRLCVARRPTPDELARLTTLYNQGLKRYKANFKSAQAILGTNATGDGIIQKAAWTVVANVLLNLDETLTKE